MNSEIQIISNNLQSVLDAEPWYGKSVYRLLEEIKDDNVYIKPNNHGHSLIELLYHMVTWAEFTKDRIEKKLIEDEEAFGMMDWRLIHPSIHTWQNGITALKTSHQNIIELLKEKNDLFLEEKVGYRKYDFRFLLNGLVQHNIYHIGQIAYVNKWLA